MSSFGLIEKNMERSHIYLSAVINKSIQAWRKSIRAQSNNLQKYPNLGF